METLCSMPKTTPPFSLYDGGAALGEVSSTTPTAVSAEPKAPLTFLNAQADVFVSSLKFKAAITLSASSTTTLFVIPDQGADDRNRD